MSDRPASDHRLRALEHEIDMLRARVLDLERRLSPPPSPEPEAK